MFEFTQSLRNMTDAIGQLDELLGDRFIRPTIFDISAYSVYAEWGRDNSTQPTRDSVWLCAYEDRVVMNANFRDGWPESGAPEFNAEQAKEWLLDLTRDWKWDFERNGSMTSESIRRTPGQRHRANLEGYRPQRR